MIRIFLFTIVLIFCNALQAQHFDPLYDFESSRTWRDSGYYFVPELVRIMVFDVNSNPSGITNVTINFQSTDQSGLSYTGSAILFYPEENLPPEIDIEIGSNGFATMLLPQDLLFCPSPEDEQGMGQNDPYFPLSLIARIQRVDGIVPENPILALVQLNDFSVN